MAFWKKPDEPSPAPKAASVPPVASQPSTPPPPVFDPVEDRFSKIRSALGSGTIIQGKLSFDSPVRIDGKLSGEVFSSKPFYVGKTGQVDAQIEVAALVVAGNVRGRIQAQERVEVLKGGSLSGDVISPVLVVEEGADLNAQCVYKAPKASEPAKPAEMPKQPEVRK